MGEKADFTMTYELLEPFSASSPPEEFAEKGAVIDQLFIETLRYDDVTVPIPSGEDGGYYVFHITEDIAPEPMSLEEATPGIRKALITRNSDRAVNDAANTARTEISEALEAGKDIAAAAKEAGVELIPVPNFSLQEPAPVDEVPDAELIAAAVEGVGAGEISEVVQRAGDAGYLLVYVDRIEIYEDEEKSSAERALSAAVEGGIKRRLFSAWFNQRRAESGSERAGSAEPAI